MPQCSATGIGPCSLHWIHFSEVSEQVTNNNSQQIKDTYHAMCKTTIVGLEYVEIQFVLPLDVHAP